MILSITPPKYPDIAPKIPPTITEIDIAKIPTFSDTLAPCISLANISLPNSSVPNQCSPLGDISLSARFCFITTAS